jgi:hypothetical protein
LDLAKYLGEGTSLKEAEEKSSAFLFLFRFYPQAQSARFARRLATSQILLIRFAKNVISGQTIY